MSVDQLDIFDALAEGQRLRDEGMAAVTDASDEIAIKTIDQAIAAFNAAGEPWSANDMRDLLPDVRQPLIGARIRAAAMRKEMRKVGYVPSTLPSTHAHPIALWKGVEP